MITLDEFKKLEIKIGHILLAEKVPDSDKLLKLSVDFGLKPSTDGSRDIRQIISGIAPYFPNLEDLVAKKCAFVANIESRVIKGLESQGMILAVSNSLKQRSNKALEESFTRLKITPWFLISLNPMERIFLLTSSKSLVTDWA